VEAGNSTQLDLRRAEIALRTAEANHAAYTRQAAKDRNALVLLLGQPLTPELSRQLDEAMALPDDIVPTGLPSGLPSELLARRPDIRAAEQMLIGANANIGAARAAFFPTISLTGSAGTASASLDGCSIRARGPGASCRRSRCPSSAAARCAPIWTWRTYRRASRSPTTRSPSRRPSPRWLTGGQAHAR
jgi:outer membrane protein TolC